MYDLTYSGNDYQLFVEQNGTIVELQISQTMAEIDRRYDFVKTASLGYEEFFNFSINLLELCCSVPIMNRPAYYNIFIIIYERWLEMMGCRLVSFEENEVVLKLFSDHEIVVEVYPSFNVVNEDRPYLYEIHRMTLSPSSDRELTLSNKMLDEITFILKNITDKKQYGLHVRRTGEINCVELPYDVHYVT